MLPEQIRTLPWDLPGLNPPALPSLRFPVHLEDPGAISQRITPGNLPHRP
jgi:hypothetical protein